MRPPRFTLRRAMALVALAALASSTVPLRQKSRAFAHRAQYHHQAMISGRKILEIRDNLTGELLARPATCDRLDTFRKDYHRAWCLEYRRVASRPWLSVRPEPPGPRWAHVALGTGYCRLSLMGIFRRRASP